MALYRKPQWMALHGWCGIGLGLLLYAVLLSGAVATLAEELGTWADPLPSSRDYGVPSGVDQGLAPLIREMDPAYLDLVLLYPRAGGRTRVVFYGDIQDVDGRVEHRSLMYDLHPDTREVLSRHRLPAGEIFDIEPVGALSNYFSELHLHLLLPSSIGQVLGGIAALALLLLSISGFVVHRHLFSELFTWRRQSTALVGVRDSHTVAGTWTLPFLTVIAITGGYFGLNEWVSTPVLKAALNFAEPGRYENQAFSPPPNADGRHASRAGLDDILEDARTRNGSGEPFFVVIERWGRRDARIAVWMTAARGKLINNIWVYDGATGQFVASDPMMGRMPSMGGDLIALMRPLHFGDFAGLAGKLAWAGLGLSAAYVTFSGMWLWLRRRAGREVTSNAETLVTAVAYGLPLAMALVLTGNFLHRWVDCNIYTLLNLGFGVGAMLSLLLALALPVDRLRRCLQCLTALGLLLALAARMAAGGPGWLFALGSGQHVVVMLDVVLLVIAVALLCFSRRSSGSAPRGEVVVGAAAEARAR